MGCGTELALTSAPTEDLREQAAETPHSTPWRSYVEMMDMTRGGFTQIDVDRAGHQLIDVLIEEITMVANEAQNSVRIQAVREAVSARQRGHKPEYRPMVDGDFAACRISFRTKAPADAGVDLTFTLEVPRDAAGDDDVVLRPSEDQLGDVKIRVNEILPQLRDALRVRLRILAEHVIRFGLDAVTEAAESSFLQSKGYTSQAHCSPYQT